MWPSFDNVERSDVSLDTLVPDSANKPIICEERFLSAFVAAERGYIDEIIMPHATRRRVARAFARLRQKKAEKPWRKHDNIPL